MKKRRAQSRAVMPVRDLWLADQPIPSMHSRALVSYMTEPLRNPTSRGGYHQNQDAARLIVQSLNALGYVVDAVDFRGPFESEVGRDYELAFGFGPPFEAVCRAGRAETSISYATTAHWSHHNRAESRRLEAVNRARDSSLRPVRILPEWDHFRASTATITVGNSWTASTYGQCGRPVLSVREPFVIPSVHPEARDWDAARRRFIFISGSGLINKGFDLVVQAFAGRPDLHLDVVCRPSKREVGVLEVFADELASPNITFHGELRADGDDFRRVVTRSGYAILPSCSEGAAGSAIVPGLHGAVPLVTETCGVDVVEPIQAIAGTTLNEVLEAVDRAADLSPQGLRELSSLTQDAMRRAFDRRTYPERFSAAVELITAGSEA